MSFPRGREVQLDAEDLEYVDDLTDAALALNLRDRFPTEQRRQNVWLGNAGELAVARGMGWPDPVAMISPDDAGRPHDVGPAQVRARAREGWDLLIAPEDRKHEDQPFILAVPWGLQGARPGRWLIQGWCYGREAMTAERWTGDARHALHGLVPHDCWAVPARELRDLEELQPRERLF